MSGIGSRRHRITLYGENRETGAGGRALVSHPIIADVWAAAEQETSVMQVAGGMSPRASVRFTLHFDRAYLVTKQVDWNSARFRVQSLKATGTNVRQIEISGTEIL